MHGKGEVWKSPNPSDKWLPAGVAVLQCKFFCRGWVVLVTGLGWQWDCAWPNTAGVTWRLSRPLCSVNGQLKLCHLFFVPAQRP